MLLIVLTLLAELALLIEMRKRLRGFNAPEVICWFLFVSQIVYLNGDAFFPYMIDDAPWANFSFQDHPQRLVYYYLLFFVILYSSTIGYRNIAVSKKDFAAVIKKISDQIGRFEFPAMVFVGTAITIQLLTLRWSVTWSNHVYTMMNSGDGYIVSPKLGMVILSLATNSVYISAIFLARRVAVKGTGQPYFWLACYVWILIYQLSSASRSGAAALAVLFIFIGVISEKKRPLLMTFLALAFFNSYASAISARSVQNLGLSELPGNLILPYTAKSGISLTELIGNFFTGAFVTGDGLAYSTTYSTMFKLLSLSPFPSVVDGFNNYVDETAMLSAVVPMSSFSEVVHFGPFYFCLFWGAIFITSRKLISSRAKLGLFYYFACAFQILFIIEASTYPTRNTFRQVIYLYFIAVVIVEVINSREQKRRELEERA